MKKYLMILLLFIYCLLLSACQQNDELYQQTENTRDIDKTDSNQEEEVPQEADPVLNKDYELIGGTMDDSYLFALGFVGTYADTSEEDLTSYAANFAGSYLQNRYDTVFMEGGELFVIVPKYEGTTITVRSVDTNGANNVVGDVVFTTNNTLFVMCNPSELRSNVDITVTYGDRESVFSPFISLMDGSLTMPDLAMEILMKSCQP